MHDDLIARLEAADYWRVLSERGPALKPLAKECHDCAVACGFYEQASDELAAQPRDVIEGASARWFCHNHRKRACRGNINRIAALKASGQGEG